VSAWKVILATVVIFACGVLTGAMAFKMGRQTALVPANSPALTVNPKNPAPPGWQLQRLQFFKRMEKQLDLAPEQREQLDKIMRESQERVKPLWDKIGPQMDEELKRVRQEVAGVLNPEQQKKMDELMHRGRKPESAPGNPRPARPEFSMPLETNRP
jgi:Spy/CpxP family protein refolding chaperone